MTVTWSLQLLSQQKWAVKAGNWFSALLREAMSTLSSKYAPVTEFVEVKRKTSQSLFLVGYLGNEPVHENNSNATISWVIDELRLKKRGESQCWFTPGPDHFALVKENGEGQLKYAHRDIVRCCLGRGESPFFAVVVKERVLQRRKAGPIENAQCICHAFEAASTEDVSASLTHTMQPTACCVPLFNTRKSFV